MSSTRHDTITSEAFARNIGYSRPDEETTVHITTEMDKPQRQPSRLYIFLFFINTIS